MALRALVAYFIDSLNIFAGSHLVRKSEGLSSSRTCSMVTSPTVAAVARALVMGVAEAAARHVMCVAEAATRHVALLHLVPKGDVLCSNERGAHLGYTWCILRLLDCSCLASRGFGSLSTQTRFCTDADRRRRVQ